MNRIARTVWSWCLFAIALTLAGSCGNRDVPSSPSTISPSAPTRDQTYTLVGTVTEPGSGPVAGVVVKLRPNCCFPPASVGSATTDGAGRYEISGLSGPVHASTTKAGYEYGEQVNPLDMSANQKLDLFIQRVFRIRTGDSLDQAIFEDDTGWLININEDGCGPCKVVRVVGDVAGMIDVDVSWQGADRSSGVWLARRNSLHATRICCAPAVTTTVPIAADEEILLYVEGKPSAVQGPHAFHLATSRASSDAASTLNEIAATPGAAVRAAVEPRGARRWLRHWAADHRFHFAKQ